MTMIMVTVLLARNRVCRKSRNLLKLMVLKEAEFLTGGFDVRRDMCLPPAMGWCWAGRSGWHRWSASWTCKFLILMWWFHNQISHGTTGIKTTERAIFNLFVFSGTRTECWVLESSTGNISSFKTWIHLQMWIQFPNSFGRTQLEMFYPIKTHFGWTVDSFI